MKVWVCQRSEESWKGALIIGADTIERAIEIFEKHEDGDEPYSVKEMDTYRAGVLYEDDLR